MESILGWIWCEILLLVHWFEDWKKCFKRDEYSSEQLIWIVLFVCSFLLDQELSAFKNIPIKCNDIAIQCKSDLFFVCFECIRFANRNSKWKFESRAHQKQASCRQRNFISTVMMFDVIRLCCSEHVYALLAVDAILQELSELIRGKAYNKTVIYANFAKCSAFRSMTDCICYSNLHNVLVSLLLFLCILFVFVNEMTREEKHRRTYTLWHLVTKKINGNSIV